MKKFLLLFLLMPMLAFATDKHHANGGDITVNSGNTRIVDDSVEVNNKVNANADANATANAEGGSASVTGGNSNVNIADSASTAFAYAAQCGTAGGGSVRDFSISTSGESQYCKHLRISAFYEGLFGEAKSRGDNVMAQVWYNAMVGELSTAQSLIDETSFTGSMKETAGDLLLPTVLCGGLAAVSGGVFGVICAGGLSLKAVKDQDKRNARYARVVAGQEDRNTQFTNSKPAECSSKKKEERMLQACLAK